MWPSRLKSLRAVYRVRTLNEADLLLTEAIQGLNDNRHHRGQALAFRAMTRAQLGNIKEASADVATGVMAVQHVHVAKTCVSSVYFFLKIATYSLILR